MTQNVQNKTDAHKKYQEPDTLPTVRERETS